MFDNCSIITRVATIGKYKARLIRCGNVTMFDTCSANAGNIREQNLYVRYMSDSAATLGHTLWQALLYKLSIQIIAELPLNVPHHLAIPFIQAMRERYHSDGSMQSSNIYQGYPLLHTRRIGFTIGERGAGTRRPQMFDRCSIEFRENFGRYSMGVR